MVRHRRAWLALVPLIAALWAGLGWLGERHSRDRLDRRHAELARSFAAVTAERDRLEADRDALADDRSRLERELLAAKLEQQSAARALAALAARLEREDADAAGDAAASADELDAARRSAEELRRLNLLFRRWGADWVRFLSVGPERDRNEITDVQLLVLGNEGVPEGVFLADRATLRLDRATGTVTIGMRDVVRVLDGKRFPRAATHRVEIEAADPRALELELGDLIAATGRYPTEAGPPVRPADLAELALWRDRLQAFLDYAAGSERLVLQRLRGASDATFRDVEVLGYTEKGVWSRRIKAAALEVWVDEDTGAVELRLTDGFLEHGIGKMTFPVDRPYRLPLPGAARPETEKRLTGFVKRWRSHAR